MMLARLFVFISITLILSVTQAQSPVLSDENPIITPDNAGQVEQLAMLGRGYPMDVAYSPNGELLAISTTIGVWLYDAENLQIEPRLLTDNRLNGWVGSIDFSPDSQYIAAGIGGENFYIGNMPLVVWDVQTGETIHYHAQHTQIIYQVKYSPGGHMISSVSGDNTLRTWDATTGGLINTVIPDDIGGTTARSLAYSPDGMMIAVSHTRETNDVYDMDIVRVYDSQSYQIVQIFNHWASSLAYSQDGHYLAMAGDGLQVWELATGNIHIITDDDGVSILDVAFHPNGEHITIAKTDGTIVTYDVQTGDMFQTLSADAGLVMNIAYHPDGYYLASRHTDNTVRIWDTQTGVQLVTIGDFSTSATVALLSPDNQQILYSESGRIARVNTTHLQAYQPIQVNHAIITLDPDLFFLTPTIFMSSPDGRLIMASQENYNLTVWDAQTGEKLYDLEALNDKLLQPQFSPNSRWISAIDDGNVRLWDAHTGEHIHTFELTIPISEENRTYQKLFIRSFAYHPDSTQIALSVMSPKYDTGYQITAYLYDITTFTEIEHHTVTDFENWLTIHAKSDGQFVWSEYDPDSGFNLWDVATETHIMTLPSPDTQGMTDFSYSPDGRLILLRGYPYQLFLWDAQTGAFLTMAGGHTNTFFSQWSFDGRYIVTGSRDGTIRIWGVPIQS